MDYIESVPECLAEADTDDAWKAVGIYDGRMLVGFAMYGYFCSPQSEGQVWLDRILIDKTYQGKGYGKASVRALLKKLCREYGCHKIYLSVYDVNKPAIGLYHKAGFHFNGELDTKGERIMVYNAP